MGGGGKSSSSSAQQLQAFECSLKDLFGLKTLHNCFNIPYMERKLANLQEAVKAAKAELKTVRGGDFCRLDRICRWSL